MDPRDGRLPDDLAHRLADRAQALLPLGTLLADEREPEPAEHRALGELAERLRATYPYPEPAYAGQMLKPPAPVAWAAYAATMLLNPNNHALDGGPATAALEREAGAPRSRAGGGGADRRDAGILRAPGPPLGLGDDRQPRGAVGGARA